MFKNLTGDQLKKLLKNNFNLSHNDTRLVILVDVPNTCTPDNEEWHDRRKLAAEWVIELQKVQKHLPLESIHLIYYENTGSNNADLPKTGFLWPGNPELAKISVLQKEGTRLFLRETLAQTNIVLAPTQFSTTAPLKILGKELGFRGATMPGFTRQMIPALLIDYQKVHNEVMKIKQRLDESQGMKILFAAEGQSYEFFADLRFRTAHASSGLFHKRGQVGNLPSGEAYIVPYEGERDEASRTAGILPVQFDDEIVLYKIANNRAVEVLSKGPYSQLEAKKLESEPAYGNIAEIGFGILKSFGIKPTGSLLLDEKLGLHIAFGRSDHFGGVISPRDFKDSSKVVHIDRIYIREVQNKVFVKSVEFIYPGNQKEIIMKNGNYTNLN